VWNETIRLAEEGKTYEAPPPAPRPEAQSYQTQLSPEAVRTLLRVIEVLRVCFRKIVLTLAYIFLH
jgi:hypothetical protein